MKQTNMKQININSKEEIAKLDKSNMLSSIEAFDKQVEHAWRETKSLSFPRTKPINKVLIAGMGGSGLGADVIKHLFKDELEIPFDFVHSYSLPKYVDQQTLVILSSYSGTTEEVLSCAEQVKTTRAQVACVTSGGKLAQLAKENRWPIYLIDPIYNPCGQPRMAIGYSIFGTIGLCTQAGLFSLSDSQVLAVQNTIREKLAECSVEIDQENNPAKMLAYEMTDRKTVIVAAEFLEGAAHVAANQGNENAKSFVDYKVIPELNHHLMEGLRFPLSNKDTHVFFFINSELYLKKNQQRMIITQSTVEENGIDTLMIKLEAKTKIEQVFEMITLFAFAGFYLSMLEGIDPSPIPFVDSFKDQLK